MLTPGTKVVLRSPVASNHRVHAADSVAVIVQAPVDEQHSYRVRFPDGDEVSLRRDEFVLLATVKASGLGPGAAALEDRALEQWVVLRVIVGSRAYGLDREGSDTDLRGVYAAPVERLWSLAGAPDQLENHETDEVYWELKKFLILALKANPNVLEVLHSPLVVDATAIGQELVSLRSIFVSKLVYQTYNGYVLSQFRKMEQRRKAGLEPKRKHAMHLIRLLLAGVEALHTGVVPVEVAAGHRDRLIAIRDGSIDLAAVDEWRRALHAEFDEAYAMSALPERPNFAAADAFLVRARRASMERPK